MKVYVAASFAMQEIMRDGVAAALAPLELTSSWLHEPPILAGGDHEEWEKRARANEDRLDIDRSEVVVVYTEVASTTGGLHWETGYAIGTGKRVIIVGPRTNVFHYMNDIEVVATSNDLMVALGVWHSGKDAYHKPDRWMPAARRVNY